MWLDFSLFFLLQNCMFGNNKIEFPSSICLLLLFRVKLKVEVLQDFNIITLYVSIQSPVSDMVYIFFYFYLFILEGGVGRQPQGWDFQCLYDSKMLFKDLLGAFS